MWGHKMKKDPLVIYWSPNSSATIPEIGEWTMMYREPYNLYSQLIKNREPAVKDVGFFSCPAVKNRIKNTFVFENSLESSYDFDGTDIHNLKIFPKSKTYINAFSTKPTSLVGGAYITLSMAYYFFSEEPVSALINPPTFHEPKYLKYATFAPGEFDIGRWFRPFPLEFQTWSNKGEFILEDKEPLFYFEIKTDRDVILKRFEINEKILSYSASCVGAPLVYGKHLPLSDRYDKFISTKMNRLILKEIKKNLID